MLNIAVPSTYNMIKLNAVYVQHTHNNNNNALNLILTSGIQGQGADQNEDKEGGKDAASAAVVIPQLPGEPDVAVGGEDGAGGL